MPSTVIKEFSYDVARSLLIVKFISGIVYEFENVPASVYEAMKTSFAKGVFFNENIKGKYTFNKVNE